MTATSLDAIFFPRSVNRLVLFPLCGLSSLGENLDLAMVALVALRSSLESSFWKFVLDQSTATASVVARKVGPS